MDEQGLMRLRDGFGLGASSFGGDFDAVPGERWWSLSGIAHPDYNVALVHGGDVTTHAATALDRIADMGAPSLIMLAGRGLEAAQILVDAGWVCVRAMPLMTGGAENRWDPDGVEVRLLTGDDEPAAAGIVEAAYGITPDTAAQVYSREVLSRPGVTGYGADIDGRLAAVAVVHSDGVIATSWSLATDPAVRRRGLAAGVMAGLVDSVVAESPDVRIVGVVTRPAEALYRRYARIEPVEYWQVWSRPRWMLGA